VRLCRVLAQNAVVVSVLHDLNFALQADRLLVMQDGVAVALGSPVDASVHRALEQVFAGALRVQLAGGRWTAVPEID